jgi:hypothetical protein
MATEDGERWQREARAQGRIQAVDTEQDLIILTYVDYIRLRREVKAAGFDLCYTAQVEQPVRIDWSPNLARDPEILRQIMQRRPADPSFRIAAVRLIKQGNWFFRPDQYAVTFHAVGALRDAEFQHYLAEHHIQSSTDASRALLTAS